MITMNMLLQNRYARIKQFYILLLLPILLLGMLSGCTSPEEKIKELHEIAGTKPAETVTENTAPKEVTVFLVRHAEKVLDQDNPPLTSTGKTRAIELAAMLGEAGITNIHSSDYVRTLETAAPLAKLLGIEVEIYDPRDLLTIRDKVKADGGIHLIVGHSNTTPPLTKLLGGDPGTEINEASEYDRLYYVNIASDGSVKSELLRYGEPYKP